MSTTPLIESVDGATVPEITGTVTTVEDDSLYQLLEQLNTSADNYGHMMIVGFGLIIGLILVALARWWK